MDLVKERATTLFDAHRLLELSVAEYELIGMQRVAQLRLTKLKVINESTNQRKQNMISHLPTTLPPHHPTTLPPTTSPPLHPTQGDQ